MVRGQLPSMLTSLDNYHFSFNKKKAFFVKPLVMDDQSTWNGLEIALVDVVSRIINRADNAANGKMSEKVLWGKAFVYPGSLLLNQFIDRQHPRIAEGDCSSM